MTSIPQFTNMPREFSEMQQGQQVLPYEGILSINGSSNRMVEANADISDQGIPDHILEIAGTGEPVGIKEIGDILADLLEFDKMNDKLLNSSVKRSDNFNIFQYTDPELATTNNAGLYNNEG